MGVRRGGWGTYKHIYMYLLRKQEDISLAHNTFLRIYVCPDDVSWGVGEGRGVEEERKEWRGGEGGGEREGGS